MEIQYNILWFEDTRSFLDAIKKRLDNYLLESDLRLNCLSSSDGSALNGIDANSDLDLILIDYNLVDVKGNELIDKIRKMKLLTEIIYYSKDKEFKDSIGDDVEGIYFSDKSDLFTKTKRIIDKTVRTVNHVSIQRGNFISEAITLESKIVDIIMKHYRLKGERGGKEFRSRVYESEFFTTMQKFKLLKSILKDKIEFCDKRSYVVRSKALKKLKDILNDFQDEVIEMRNLLAHTKDVTDGGIPVFKTKNGETLRLDGKGIKDARKKLSKHLMNLKDIEAAF